MLDYKLEISIISLQEYLDEICYTAEEAFNDFGVVAKHYVYARLYDGNGLQERCFVPVQYKVEEAIIEATNIVADHFKWLHKQELNLG